MSRRGFLLFQLLLLPLSLILQPCDGGANSAMPPTTGGTRAAAAFQLDVVLKLLLLSSYR